MASEKSLWINLRKKMVPDFWYEATRHEDAISRGIADVSFVQADLRDGKEGTHGWMELKNVSLAPVRATTVVRLDHYTDEQRIWLHNKGKHAGMTFLLLQLERDYLLFDHGRAQLVGKLVKDDLFEHCNWYSRGKLDPHGLARAIRAHG